MRGDEKTRKEKRSQKNTIFFVFFYDAVKNKIFRCREYKRREDKAREDQEKTRDKRRHEKRRENRN